jgi:hypothetical protein
VLGVAVREQRGGEEIALHGAGGKSGGGSHALYVVDDGGNFGVITEADEFGHEREAGTGGGGHGTGAGPSSAEGHADGSQFVFGLHYGEGGAAGFLVDAEALQIADQGFDERGRRRDGIPGDHRNAREHGTKRTRRVAFDDDLARVGIHALDPESVGLGVSLGGVVIAGLRGAPVQIGGLGLALAELLHQRLVDLLHVDGEQPGNDAVVKHVAHQLAQLGIRAHRRDQLVEGRRVEMQIGPQGVELERLVIDDGGAAIQLHHVFARSFRVHGDQEIDLLLAADITVFAGADGEPGGQSGDVGREHVLAGDGHAHLENGTHQDGVGSLAAGSVDCGDLNGEIVDYGMAGVADARLRRRYF